MKINQMFPARYLRGQDLHAPILVVITAIETAVVHPRPGQEESKFVLRFHHIDPKTNKAAPLPTLAQTPTGHGTILNRTLAYKLADILQSDDTDAWIGKRVVLEQGTSRTGQKTVTARAPKNGSAPAGSSTTPAPSATKPPTGPSALATD